MRRMLFIYNPRAGKGLIRTHLSYVLEAFAAHDFEVTVRPTLKPQDAVEIMANRSDDYELVVCSGGDGTLDEVVTGMMRDGREIPIGYIPAGSTNDFANSLGIPKKMKAAAVSIAKGQVYHFDVGRINSDHYFVYVAAFGAFTDVAYETNQDMKNVLGHAAYIIEGARRLPSLKFWKLKIESDEYTGEGEFMLGLVTNSNSVGGFKSITGGDVTLNDGLFEVTLIKKPENPLDWAGILNMLLIGVQHEKVVTFKTSHLVIESEEPLSWTTDGEFGGSYTRCEIENCQHALPLVMEDEPTELLDDGEEEAGDEVDEGDEEGN
ncbi:MAG: YegS/Rv2252/BmrU family lipid kinase [Lachnospiraceae bacterium]|nr:YegS/Rv2252/BmrU family lipid kinase [Lachnospiraceae bacterium]